jgi:hypothetical protein
MYKVGPVYGSPSILGIAEFIVSTGSFFSNVCLISQYRRAFPKSEDNPTGSATCMTFCMDYEPHDRLVHLPSYSSKQAALESEEASKTIEWEQIPRHPTVH